MDSKRDRKSRIEGNKKYNKQKYKKTLQEKKSKQESQEVVVEKKQTQKLLIICEDSKTTPSYFKDLCYDLGLGLDEVEIYGEECGSAPISVVNFAIKKIKDDLEENEGKPTIKKVFCVIDEDMNLRNVKKVSKLITDARLGSKISLNLSVPCFELWIYLHFVDKKFPQLISCKQVQSAIKTHFKGYKKGARLYKDIKENIDKAIDNSKWLKQQVELTGSNGPYTDIHLLVQELRGF